MITNLNRLKELNIQDFTILVLSLLIPFGVLQVDHTIPGFGWELPKVLFWQLVLTLLILVTLIYVAFCFWSYSIESFYITNVITNIVLMLLITLSSFTFEVGRFGFLYELQANTLLTEIYSNSIGVVLNQLPSNVALLGSTFRGQGLFFYVLFFTSLTLLPLLITKKNMHFLFLGLFTSVIIQTLIALAQVITAFLNNLQIENQVYGSLGQPNFLVGHMLIGFFIGLFYLSKIKNLPPKVFIGLLLGLICVVIVASQSYWGIVTLFFGFCILVLFHLNLIKDSYLLLLIYVITLLLPILSTYFVAQLNEVFSTRILIWNDIIDIYLYKPMLSEQPFNVLLFGSGLDTLSYFFEFSNKFAGSIVDRAHNFIFDLLSQIGVIGLIAITFCLGVLLYKLFRKYQDNSTDKRATLSNLFKGDVATLILVIVLVWVFRAGVHTNSVVNIIDFLIILSIAVGCLFDFKLWEKDE